jgi:mono/diheme cytochrome c family protein
MAIMKRHGDTEAQRRSFDLCVSVSLWLTIAMIVATMVSVAAQIRPTPQPPRRPSAPPRTAPPPKKAPAEPDDDRGGKEAAPPPAATTRQSAAADTTPAGTGAALYKKNGCYECHADQAQGGPQGPRLGPNPIPLPRFLAYVRNPAGDMPPFTAKVISDQDLTAIYAFLQSRPMPPPVQDIPLLAP